MSLAEDDCQKLFAALNAADEGDVLELDEWLAKHGQGDVLVAEHVIDSHKGKQLSNMGRPLYVAVVFNQAAAVRHILAAGADCNAAHPTHGDTCLLHACQNGYDECLQVLLEHDGMKAASHRTIDRKIFLGQGMPQWEEGGQSALMVAACNGRVEAVKQLLQHQDAVAHWLSSTDTFGRTVLQATFDSIAECDRPAKQADLTAIASLLLKATGVDDEEAVIAESIPDREEARERRRERMKAVRARCLSADRAAKDADLARGLEAIAQHYVPLHEEAHSAEAIRSAASAQLEEVTEPFPQVLCFPLVQPELCDMLWAELHHYEQAACANPSLELPLRVRHDGNLGDLQDCGFKTLIDVLLEQCTPVLQHRMPELGEVEAYHAFVTRNYVGREENATFKMHCDKSELTLNLCLHAAEDFAGSTVGFFAPKRCGEVPTDEERTFTYTHAVGRAVMHSGSTWHRTDPITKGTRGSLIVWARRKASAAASLIDPVKQA